MYREKLYTSLAWLCALCLPDLKIIQAGVIFLACFAVNNNRKGNTKFFARPAGIIRAGKDHKEIQ